MQLIVHVVLYTYGMYVLLYKKLIIYGLPLYNPVNWAYIPV